MTTSAWHFLSRGALVILSILVAANARSQSVSVANISFAYASIRSHAPNTLHIVLSGPAPAGTKVDITHDDGGYVYFPSRVSVPTGQSSLSVPIYAFYSFEGTIFVSAWASVPGTAEKYAWFELYGSPSFGYSIATPDVYGGDSFFSIVQILPEGADWFSFSDTSPLVSSPAPWHAGDMTYFQHWTKPVTAPTSVWMYATCRGVSREAGMTIHPRPSLMALTLNPASVKGGSQATGTLRLNFAGGAGPIPVVISDSSILVSTPATVDIPSHSLTQEFAIETLPVNKTYNVTFRARDRVTVRTALLEIHP